MIRSFRGYYGFLSNFYMQPVLYQGKEWPSSEHAYQAMKTEDTKLQERIRKLPEPRTAKSIGKNVKLRADWESIKDNFMLEILRAKFSDTSLKEKLLSTRGEYLQEGNTWHDNYWGNCYCT